ncbi:LysE family translocator [Teredinibacter haidensis]|uniref:LysE family translocator n=1 Tax=Teredinibacter haidensis TaxID=2731755 RepID=UPI001C8DF627|nr:LysE family transporter [Teredinibacter haidensis]
MYIRRFFRLGNTISCTDHNFLANLANTSIAVKLIGVAYLIFLGVKVLRPRSFINLKPTAKQPLKTVFTTGLLYAALNPKPGMLVLAFVPKFVNPEPGSVTTKMIAYGIWFAILSTAGFSLMEMLLSILATSQKNRPKVISGLNIGAGLTSIASGFPVAALRQR